MPEGSTIDPNFPPLTIDMLAEQLSACGLKAGDHVIVHSSLSSLGWVVGGTVALIEALMRVVTPDGTIMMPTHTNDNSDPAQWQHPPVPLAWWSIIREHMPPFDPDHTPTREIGRVAENFRRWRGAVRSTHPQVSFAAWGRYAQFLTDNHTLEYPLGEGSPLARLYDIDGSVLLIGVDHDRNTSLHLAEYRTTWPSRKTMDQSFAMLVDGQRQWVTYPDVDFSSEDFNQIGTAYEESVGYTPAQVGKATVRLHKQRPLVDFAVDWMSKNRK